jgi:hypothetical protein
MRIQAGWNFRKGQVTLASGSSGPYQFPAPGTAAIDSGPNHRGQGCSPNNLCSFKVGSSLPSPDLDCGRQVTAKLMVPWLYTREKAVDAMLGLGHGFLLLGCQRREGRSRQ